MKPRIEIKEVTKTVTKSINLLPFSLVLFCIFMTLKLTHTLDWEWIWVTSPLWLPYAVFIAVIVLIFVFVIFVFCLAALGNLLT